MTKTHLQIILNRLEGYTFCDFEDIGESVRTGTKLKYEEEADYHTLRGKVCGGHGWLRFKIYFLYNLSGKKYIVKTGIEEIK